MQTEQDLSSHLNQTKSHIWALLPLVIPRNNQIYLHFPCISILASPAASQPFLSVYSVFSSPRKVTFRTSSLLTITSITTFINAAITIWTAEEKRPGCSSRCLLHKHPSTTRKSPVNQQLPNYKFFFPNPSIKL